MCIRDRSWTPWSPPVDPVAPVDPVDPVLPGVIIGGAVILGAYETGTGIYRLMNMQGLPLPSNRIELAELVWERAGKPEPQNMTDEDPVSYTHLTRVQSSASHRGTNWLQMRRISGSSAAEVRSAMPMT